jgi:hypothetical protein
MPVVMTDLLQTILDVVHDVVAISGCAFFLKADDDRPDPEPAAAINFNERLDTDNHQALAEAVQQVMTADEPENPVTRIAQHTYVAVPVRKGSKKFGALVVKKDGETPFPEKNNLRTFISFANMAAIGINDCRFQESIDDIEASLDDVLSTI